jgi:RNA polymerase-binding transcription factor
MTATAKKRSPEDLARRELLDRKRALLARHATLAHDAQALYEERESDPQDRAADVSAAGTLERIDENEMAQLARVVAALARLDGGTWGRCLVCGAQIDPKRLRAVPEAARCTRCTNHD